jgi:phosphotransferase system  glucose/maltose/N-acetylglucosamine-specific IIC component
VTEGVPPSSSSARFRATPATSGLTAAAWNRRSRADRMRALPHWPQWLRVIPATNRPDVLMRLFAVLFLLLPGGALVISTQRHAHAAMASAVLFFVVAHAALHALSAWRATTSRLLPAPLRYIDRHSAWAMLGSAWVPLAIQGVHTQPTSTLSIVGLVIGGLCQLCSVRVTADRLRNVLLVLGSALQFIAVALLSSMAVG